MLVLQDVHELVRDRHLERDVEFLAAHDDALALGVVVGEHAGGVRRVRTFEKIDVARSQAERAHDSVDLF